LVVILGNFHSHYTNDIKKLADKFGIQSVFLSKYSHHLNSAEPLWRELKYVLLRVFVTNEDASNH